MRKITKVVFYFPWKEVSGGPYYLTALARELQKNPLFQVYYTDFEPGLSDDLLQESNVTKIRVFEDNLTINIVDEPIILITPIYWANQLPPLHSRSKILFFNWHVCSIPVLTSQWNLSKKETDMFLNLVAKNEAVFFCDYSHWHAQNTKKIKLNKTYVPAALPDESYPQFPSLINEKEINIVVLGRLCVDKIYSVINLLDNLNKIETPLVKNVYIIGDGPEKELIDIQKYHINIFFLGTITGKQLKETISKKGDVLFAMGMSVLEGALLKMPSVIMPHNVKPFKGDRYVYIQDTKDYCLGWFDVQMDDMAMSEKFLKNILDDVYLYGKKEKLGLMAYEYYQNNHKIDKTVKQLESAIQKTTMTFLKFKKIDDKFNNRIKKYYFFGIPIVKLYKKNNGLFKGKIFNLFPFEFIESKKPLETILCLFNVPFIRIKYNIKNIVSIKLFIPFKHKTK